MRSQWVFKQCDQQKQVAREYWAEKTQRIERLLSHFTSDFHRVRLTLYHHRQRDEWELRAVLHLPTSTLVAQQCGQTVYEVIDEVTDDLTSQIRRHKGKLHQDQLDRRRAARREQLLAAERFLEQDVTAERPDSFVRLLLPYMNQVYDHARRELMILELEEQLPKGEWTATDLVDDVLLTACETYDHRPQGLSIDAWLINLLNQRIESVKNMVEPVTLATVPVAIDKDDTSDGDLSDTAFWLRELLEPVDEVSVEELLADGDAEVLERSTVSEIREQVNRVLEELPKFQRQSLMLHDVYGFPLEEVALALERDAEHVRADLMTGREKIRRCLVSAF